jgi:hypothetical protein
LPSSRETPERAREEKAFIHPSLVPHEVGTAGAFPLVTQRHFRMPDGTKRE